MKFGGWVVDSKHKELILKFTNKPFILVRTDATTSY